MKLLLCTEEEEKENMIQSAENPLRGNREKRCFHNSGYCDIKEFFDYIHDELGSMLRLNLETSRHLSLICSISVIYNISFDINRIQHMTFKSQKCGIKRDQNIDDSINFIRSNLKSKMNMFCNPSDNNPYYILQHIEFVSIILFI